MGEDGSNAVQRFNLPSLSPDITIPLPPAGTFGPTTAIDLQAATGSPHTVAILEGNINDDPSDVGGPSIFDDTIQRPGPNSLFAGTDVEWLQWGANASTLYGGNSDIPPGFYDMDVTSSGLVEQSLYQYVLDGNGHFDATTGYVYGDDGQVFNGVTGEPIGSFNLADFAYYTMCAVDSSQGLVFYFGEFYNVGGFGGIFGIEVFDQKTFGLLRIMVLPQIGGIPTHFIRWGNSGLAVTSVSYPYATVVPFNGAIYIVDGSFVNGTGTPDFSTGPSVDPLPNFTSMSPQSAAAGSGNVTLTVKGSNFEVGSVVTFGTNPLDTE